MSQELTTSSQEPKVRRSSDKQSAAGAKYWWVKFHQAADKNATPDVILACNGDTLLLQRGKEVCVPDRFLEIADNALQERFTQEPGHERKALAPVITFPYDRIREGSEEEFRAQVKAARS